MAQKIKVMRVKFRAWFLDGAPWLYRAALKKQAVVKGDKVVKNIAYHAGLPEPITRSILTALNGAINDYLESGHPVQIENLCTFKPKVKSRGKDDPKLVNARRYRAEYDRDGRVVRENDGCIKGVALQTWPIGETKQMVKDFQFVFEGTVEGEDPEEEETE